MRATSLYLQPVDPRRDPPAPASVEAVLRRLGVLGEPLEGQRYLAGPHLLEQIGFTGCSVAVKLEPEGPEDRDFCHLVLLGPYPRPRPFVGDNNVRPRCPACGARAVDWQGLIRTWREEDTEPRWNCPACRTTTPAGRLRWRRHAAFGRLLIEVRHVFPAEAAPHDGLLRALREATDRDWDYAWAGSSG